MSDSEQQQEEFEVLQAIFNDAVTLTTHSDGSTTMRIVLEESEVSPLSFVAHIPPTYPSVSTPVFELEVPSHKLKVPLHEVHSRLDQLSRDGIGEPTLYSCVEYVKSTIKETVKEAEPTPAHQNTQPSAPEATENDFVAVSCPKIFTGEPLIDRKSTFQAHVAAVASENEVKAVMQVLLSDKKIARATHNIVAYRYFDDDRQVQVQDNDDDGETAAGSRLAHLLQILQVNNVIVVVSRWYGGIQLGPDRFKHINNCARAALEAAQFLDTSPKHKRR